MGSTPGWSPGWPAHGAGRRVGHRDKGLITLDGIPLIAHVVAGLTPQVENVIVSCNRNLQAYSAYSSTVVTDQRTDFKGPLSGLESTTPYLQSDYVAIVSCDMPHLPSDWVARLLISLSGPAKSEFDIAYAHDGVRAQYLCAVIKKRCLRTLSEFLDAGHRAVRDWYAMNRSMAVDFSDHGPCFRNYNALE